VTFECVLKGKPLPKVTWWHGNNKIDTKDKRYTHEYPVKARKDTALLTISKVKRSDQGFYRCMAENKLGKAKSDTSFLTVQCKCEYCFL
jgi:hypothetical protein